MRMVLRSVLPLLAPLVPTPRPVLMHAPRLEFNLERTDVVVPCGGGAPMFVRLSCNVDGPVRVQLWAQGPAPSRWRCAAESTIEASLHAGGTLETTLERLDLSADVEHVELRAELLGGGSGVGSSAPTVRQRVITEQKLGLIMDLERELLFSGDRGGRESTQRRILAMVRASLLQKLRQPSGDGLDSASLSFERMLSRLRRSAGFGDSSPWHRIDPERMPWAKRLREAAPMIREELKAVLSASMAETEAEGRSASLVDGRTEADGRSASLESWESASYEAIAPSWRVRHLWQHGAWLDGASQQLPATVGVLRELERDHGMRLNPLQNVACGIARQPAGSGIAPHCDGNVLGLTCHLGLLVPEGCAIEVGGEARPWSEGGLLVMDTSFPHRTWNDSPDDRYVLMLNIVRPGVASEEIALFQR